MMATIENAALEAPNVILTPRAVSEQIAIRASRMRNGDLADLRRGKTGVVAPVFQRLLDEFQEIMGANIEDWVVIAQFIAILSNNAPGARPIHSKEMRLGRALASGGHYNPKGTSSAISEERVMKLLRSPERQRGEALVRIARSLHPNFGVRGRVNVGDVADFILGKNRREIQRRIAQDYYSALYFMSKSE